MQHYRTQRKKSRWKPYLNRLNILILLVFLAFIVLIFRLGYLQLMNGQTFEELVHLTEKNVAKEGVPRGNILDRNGEVLVKNEGLQAIAYTRGPSISAKDMAQTADQLAEYIAVDIKSLTDRDLKDYFAAKNLDKINERLSDEEKQLKGSELYQAQLRHIKSSEIKYMNSKQRAAAMIFKQMSGSYAYSTTFIKNRDVTDEEIALVTENQEKLPGVSTAMDWARVYPYEGLLRSVLGGVTSEKQGLPNDQINAYLALGYARNDRVGNSYIEAQYEGDLRGSKAKYETETNQQGELVNIEQQYAGKVGNSLRLTIDSKLQQQVEAILLDYLETKNSSGAKEIYAVASRPETGEILAMAGKKIGDNGEIQDDALGTINGSFAMGSSIKGATIAAGYHYGVLNVNSKNEYLDQALEFSGTPIKASWWYKEDPNRQIVLDDKKALALSSNVYMIRLAMTLGGLNEYEENMTLEGLDPNLGEKLRYIYRQFGLGMSTGIDLQNEALGINGGNDDLGKILDLSFGQFDTYTAMQLNQYVATIANQGHRMRMHLLKEILSTPTSLDAKDQLDQVIYRNEPLLLNQVAITPEALAQIQQGFWQVINTPEGLAYGRFKDFPFEVAGKTGTAETGQSGIVNSTFVAYAPFDKPEIAISIVIPAIFESVPGATAADVGHDVLASYFGLSQRDTSKVEAQHGIIERPADQAGIERQEEDSRENSRD